MSVADCVEPHSARSLYRDHHGWLVNWLRRRLGDAADAADLAHDTFLRMLVGPAAVGLQDSRAARGYLRKVADGLCIDLWRHREVERAWLETLAVLPEAHEPSPEQRAVVVETLVEINLMLSRLPQKAAMAFVMAQIDGVRYRDIAEELDVSERMVKKYIAQGMLQCALAIDGFGP